MILGELGAETVKTSSRNAFGLDSPLYSKIGHRDNKTLLVFPTLIYPYWYWVKQSNLYTII